MSKKAKIISIVISILLALLVLGFSFLYLDRYNGAIWRAEWGMFDKAKDYYDIDALNLHFDAITRLHDPEFLDYLDGGEALQHDDYDQARALLTPLAEADYRNCAELMLQLDYKQACSLMSQQRWQEAAQLLEPLARQDHRDSAELLRQCQENIAQEAP